MMLNALDVGLINGDYAFICVDLVEDAHYGRNTWMGEDGRDAEALEAFDGLLNIHLKTPEVDTYEAFKKEVRLWVAEEPFNRPMEPDQEVGALACVHDPYRANGWRSVSMVGDGRPLRHSTVAGIPVSRDILLLLTSICAGAHFLTK